jgi:hypothetical protein
MVRDIPIR